MAQEPIEAMEQRDRAMQKLRDLTWACFLWAAGMVAVFSVIAAATLPGQAQNNSGGSPSLDPSSSSASSFTDDGQLQPPANGSFQSGGGSPPMVVSGGSH
ncbi:MAG: hypothetical protein ACYDAL_07025 [Candidatus Dormibacteraceae bacterium]